MQAVDVVRHADLHRLEGVEDVELGERDLRERVEPHRLTHHRHVEPPAPATPAGVGAELPADLAQLVARFVEQFGRERPRTDAGHVRLGDADHAVDVPGADTGAHARAPRNRVRRGDVGVGAVVDVEEGRLGALEQHVLPRLERLVHEGHGIGDVGPDAGQHVLEVAVGEFVGVEAEAVVHLRQDEVLLGHDVAELLAEDLRVEHVLQADADAGGLVGVGRADAALGRAELVLAQVPLDEAVEFLVVREDHVGVARDPQLRAIDALGGELVHLGEHHDGVDHHAVADHRRDVVVEDARGHQLQGERLAVHHQGVARVVTALVPDDHRHFLGNEVGELPLALITPLGSHHDGCWHDCS